MSSFKVGHRYFVVGMSSSGRLVSGPHPMWNEYSLKLGTGYLLDFGEAHHLILVEHIGKEDEKQPADDSVEGWLAGLMEQVNAKLAEQGGDPAWVFLGDLSGWEICVYPEFQPQLGVIHRCGYQLPLQPDGLRGTYMANALVELVKHLPEHDCAKLGRDRWA